LLRSGRSSPLHRALVGTPVTVTRYGSVIARRLSRSVIFFNRSRLHAVRGVRDPGVFRRLDVGYMVVNVIIAQWFMRAAELRLAWGSPAKPEMPVLAAGSS
jgi:hypothetical protein